MKLTYRKRPLFFLHYKLSKGVIPLVLEYSVEWEYGEEPKCAGIEIEGVFLTEGAIIEMISQEALINLGASLFLTTKENEIYLFTIPDW